MTFDPNLWTVEWRTPQGQWLLWAQRKTEDDARKTVTGLGLGHQWRLVSPKQEPSEEQREVTELTSTIHDMLDEQAPLAPISEIIRAEAQQRFEKRIAGRNLGELKEADLLLAELIGGILNHLDAKRDA